jgi:hypothetical protein
LVQKERKLSKGKKKLPSAVLFLQPQIESTLDSCTKELEVAAKSKLNNYLPSPFLQKQS